MTYAIIKAGGSQHKVETGDELLLPKINSEPNKSILFSDVLLIVDGKKTLIGTPTIKGASVKAEVLEQLKGKKIRVATFKAKSRYRRVKGHRDHLTRVKITRIVTREKKSLPTKTKQGREQKTVNRKQRKK